MDIILKNNVTLSTAQISGIYVIVNRQNKRFYIGESLDIVRRSKEHFSHLDKNSHHNRDLQNDYNVYGKNNFEFKVLLPHINHIDAIHTKAELLILESEYISRYINKYKLYNKERTLEDIINHVSKQRDFNSSSTINLRKIILNKLLNYKIEWIDEVPTFLPLDTIDNCFDFYLTDRHINKIISCLPKNFDHIAKPISLEYTGNNKKVTVKTILINNIEAFTKWLYDNKFISKDRFVHYSSTNDDEKNYKIPQSGIHKLLYFKNIIAENELPWSKFKDMLVYYNIYYKDDNGIYHATDYAKENGYIASENGKQIMFTKAGENAVIDLAERYVILIRPETP